MDYLINRKWFYHQPLKGYHVNTDTIFLASFMTMRHKDRVLDIGCGCGALMILAHHLFAPCHIDGIEINEIAVEYGLTNLKVNGMKTTIMHGRLQDYKDDKGYDVILSNPPYFHLVEPLKHDQYQGRYDHTLHVNELCQSISCLLKPKGSAFLVYPVSRFNDLMQAMYENGLSIARIRYFHPKVDKLASVMAIQIRHGLNQHCVVEKPWHDDDLITFENQLETMDNNDVKENEQ